MAEELIQQQQPAEDVHTMSSVSRFTWVSNNQLVLFIIVAGILLLLFHFRHKLIAIHDRYRTRRRLQMGYYDHIPSSFDEDIEDGLSSNTFNLSYNITSGDSRQGLLAFAKEEIKSIMRNKGLTFDEARLEYTQQELSRHNIDKDGLPRDPKLVTF